MLARRVAERRGQIHKSRGVIRSGPRRELCPGRALLEALIIAAVRHFRDHDRSQRAQRTRRLPIELLEQREKTVYTAFKSRARRPSRSPRFRSDVAAREDLAGAKERAR